MSTVTSSLSSMSFATISSFSTGVKYEDPSGLATRHVSIEDLIAQKAAKKTDSRFTLDELISIMPEISRPAVFEAIEKIASKEEKHTIQFKPLFGGHSNAKLFRFQASGKKYVLRLLETDKAIEKRSSEIAAHQHAESLQIAPKLIYVDRPCSFMIMEYVEGRTFSRHGADLNNNELATKVMQTFRKFHLSSQRPNISRETRPSSLHNQYMGNVKKGVAYPAVFDLIHKQFQEDAAKLRTQLTVTHSDLNPGNIIIGKDGNIYIIDWAEARLDNPFFDLGRFFSLAGASNEQIKNLLGAYLGREPQESEIEETLLCKDFLALNKTSRWLDLQGTKRSPQELNALLTGQLKSISDYVKEGKRPEEMSSDDQTLYALSWLKEYINNRYHISVEAFLKMTLHNQFQNNKLPDMHSGLTPNEILQPELVKMNAIKI